MIKIENDMIKTSLVVIIWEMISCPTPYIDTVLSTNLIFFNIPYHLEIHACLKLLDGIYTV